MTQKITLTAVAFSVGLLVGAVAFSDNDVAHETATGDVAEPDGTIKPAAGLAITPKASMKRPPPDAPSSTAGRNDQIPATTTDDQTGAGPDSLAVQVDAIARNWERLENAIDELQQRVTELEQAAASTSAPPPATTTATSRMGETAKPPEDYTRKQQNALVAAGVSEEWATDIVWRQNQRELKRLELRDEAIREGWFGTERYINDVRNLSADTTGLRGEIGDEAFDRYLYSLGENNRVVVESVLQGSPAEQAGLLPGDIMLGYAGESLFTYTQLRDATTTGERGETVRVEIQRGEDILGFQLPRGPLGIRLDAMSINPDS
jgi:hypothetical protein